MAALSLVLWAPILPKEVGVTRDEGARWRKSHEAEGAQGASLLGALSFPATCAGLWGRSGRKGTRTNSRPGREAGGHLRLQPGPGDKQEKGLKSGLRAEGGGSEASKDTWATPCASVPSRL